eukprot:TRINITY_DN281_c0_g5_i1.p1 TRINITY_DN281_c0_g5~~TRINITY_DN281_c0_g5_i1.p1  ORF type:complete len:262 (-),score=105.48 TRINITY_DN281_c0_g5_i1:153-938(-)
MNSKNFIIGSNKAALAQSLEGLTNEDILESNPQQDQEFNTELIATRTRLLNGPICRIATANDDCWCPSVHETAYSNRCVLLSQLIITQRGIRNPESLLQLSRFISMGGRFNKGIMNMNTNINTNIDMNMYNSNKNLITIYRFEDGKLYLWDGHHRVVALFVAGRLFLHPDEYIIKLGTFKETNSILENENYFTPFDPRFEIRLPEFGAFKQCAFQILKTRGIQGVQQFIKDCRGLYVAKRTFTNINELTHFIFTQQISQKL